jgi:AcrR family transcriptional regulator
VSVDPRHRLILECAARLFRHYGPAKTTIADIAREAQVGVGTVYLVFPSKEAIVEELSSSAHDEVLKAMREVAAARAHEDLGQRLGGVLDARITEFLRLSKDGQHACELFHCKASAVQNVHSTFRAAERALFVELLQDARDAGELAPLDVERTSYSIQRAYATLSPPWLFGQPEAEVKRNAYEMGRLLLLGLVARK